MDQSDKPFLHRDRTKSNGCGGSDNLATNFDESRCRHITAYAEHVCVGRHTVVVICEVLYKNHSCSMWNDFGFHVHLNWK